MTSGVWLLLDLNPAEQVLPLNCLQQGGMVGAHVLADCCDRLFIGVVVDEVEAQKLLLEPLYAHGVDRMLA